MDSSNVQKTPLARTLTQFTARKIAGQLALEGKAVPASVVSIPTPGVPIVTVKLELSSAPYTLPTIDVPLSGAEYVRLPIQPGCKGVVVPIDYYIGGMSGLGGGQADLARRGNLSTLVFYPVGNKGWDASEDPNALVLYGPDGVIIRNADGTSKITTSAEGVTVDPPSGKNLTVNSPAHATGDISTDTNLSATKNVSAGEDVSATRNVSAGAQLSGASLAVAGAATGAGGAAMLLTSGNAQLTAGFTDAPYTIPPPANGDTVVLDPNKGFIQQVVNNVAGFTIEPPTTGGFIVLIVINGASAGTVTFSGWSKQWAGAPMDTVNGHEFAIMVYGFVAKTAYTIQALQ